MSRRHTASQTMTGPAARSSSTARELRYSGAALCALLLLQFLLGMIVNLFVAIPRTHPGASGSNVFGRLAQGVQWAVSASAPVLQLHAFLGLILVFGAIRHAYVAMRARQSVWLVSSLVGVVGMLFAGFNGGSFVNDGHDLNSLLMAIGFAGALSSYAVGLYAARA